MKVIHSTAMFGTKGHTGRQPACSPVIVTSAVRGMRGIQCCNTSVTERYGFVQGINETIHSEKGKIKLTSLPFLCETICVNSDR
jgi:hypothetical protein